MFPSAGMIAVSTMMTIQDKQCLKAFYRAGALDENSAVTLECADYKDRFVIRRLVKQKMLAEKDGKYYMTEKYAKSMRRKMMRKER